MKTKWMTNGLVIGILVLFVGASVGPGCCKDMEKKAPTTDSTAEAGIALEPVLEIGPITGGFGLHIQVNCSNGTATNVSVTVNFTGAWMILPLLEQYHVVFEVIGDGSSEDIIIIPFGLGTTTMHITATCAEGSSASKTATGTVFLFFMLGVH
jgi:hypothetical protein